MSSILVVTEIRDNQLKSINYEAFTAAKKLSKETNLNVIALFVGSNVSELAKNPGKYGVDQSIVVEDAKLEKYSPDCYADAVSEVAKRKDAKIILMGATNLGRDLMARVAFNLDTTLAQDSTGFKVEGDQVIFVRPLYAGKVLADVQISSSPIMATLRAKSFNAEENPVETSVEKLSLDLPDPVVTVDEVIATTGGKLDVTEADIIISGGRGMKGPENWNLIEDLANAIGGAMGCSRPVSDEGWRDHGEHIGQTGKTVSPTLYVACGISGAIQHLAGISSSKYIVAINKDPEAPIFKAADYGIVGDVFEVLPKLTEEIKKVKGE
jgi:electron transfer flavoprotein alpha subunit